MNESNRAVAETARFNLKLISWPAIFAGALVVLVAQLFFGLIGLSFGAGSINPMTEAHPLKGVGLGMGIWFGITTLLCLFAGGWVAARLAGVPQKIDGALHGILGWGLATLASVYLLTSAVGGALRFTSGVAGNLLSALGQGASAAVSEGVKAVAPNGVDLSDLKTEARRLLRQTGKPELRPERLERRADRAVSDAKATAGDAAKNPQSADSEIDGLIDRISSTAGQVMNAADRQAAVNVLMARTDLNRQQAESTISQWEETARQAKEKFAQVKADAEKTAREASQKTADATSSAAAWTAVFLLLGCAAAAFGGVRGARSQFASWIGEQESRRAA